MTTDKALDLALEALTVLLDEWTPARQAQLKGMEAVTAIKQARSAPVQSCYCPNCEAMGKELAALKAQPAPVQEPVGEIGWGGSVNWHKAIPEFGTDLYTTPPAAPVQEQIELAKQIWREDQQRIAELSAEIDRLTAAQRQWVGLTDEEEDAAFEQSMEVRPKDASNKETRRLYAKAIEAKLKERNT
jgi:hypothetical protein